MFAVEKARSVRKMSLKCCIFNPAGREISVSSGKLMSVFPSHVTNIKCSPSFNTAFWLSVFLIELVLSFLH